MADIRQAIQLGAARFGTIDAIVTAAADQQFHGHLRDLALDDDYALEQLDINLLGPFRLASQVFHQLWREDPDLNRERNRSVVTISSHSATSDRPDQHAIYGGSKAALELLTRILARELEPYGVRANYVVPPRFVESDDALRSTITHIRRSLESGANGAAIR
jgi:3-oxoacyl-[acyl-carrier protein] reductase